MPPRTIVDTVLPTTMVGSYPRPHWYTQQLLGRLQFVLIAGVMERDPDLVR